LIRFNKTGGFARPPADPTRLANAPALRLIPGGSGGLCPQSPVAAGQRGPD